MNQVAANPVADTTNNYTFHDRYINRELSILDFHLRVLEQAVNPAHPLLDRLTFLLIFSSNMDEFFEIRVAGVLEQLYLGNESHSPDGLTPREVLDRISETAHAAIDRPRAGAGPRANGPATAPACARPRRRARSAF
mgnify:CR=1 FL=1